MKLKNMARLSPKQIKAHFKNSTGVYLGKIINDINVQLSPKGIKTKTSESIGRYELLKAVLEEIKRDRLVALSAHYDSLLLQGHSKERAKVLTRAFRISRGWVKDN